MSTNIAHQQQQQNHITGGHGGSGMSGTGGINRKRFHNHNHHLNQHHQNPHHPHPHHHPHSHASTAAFGTSGFVLTGAPNNSSSNDSSSTIITNNSNQLSHLNLNLNHHTLKQQQLAERAKLVNEYLKHIFDAATLIIPQFLYLGGHSSVKNADSLAKMGITHVLNMAQELKLDPRRLAENNIKLMHIAAKDAKTYDIR